MIRFGVMNINSHFNYVYKYRKILYITKVKQMATIQKIKDIYDIEQYSKINQKKIIDGDEVTIIEHENNFTPKVYNQKQTMRWCRICNDIRCTECINDDGVCEHCEDDLEND